MPFWCDKWLSTFIIHQPIGIVFLFYVTNPLILQCFSHFLIWEVWGITWPTVNWLKTSIESGPISVISMFSAYTVATIMPPDMESALAAMTMNGAEWRAGCSRRKPLISTLTTAYRKEENQNAGNIKNSEDPSQLSCIQRENIHIDHGIFGSPDLDQSGRFSAWL